MPVSQLVDDTPFCCKIKRDSLLTYLLTNRAQINVLMTYLLIVDILQNEVLTHICLNCLEGVYH